MEGRFLRLRACSGHHLHEHLFCVLKSFEERWILKFKVIVGDRDSFELALSIYEGYDAATTAENEL